MSAPYAMPTPTVFVPPDAKASGSQEPPHGDRALYGLVAIVAREAHGSEIELIWRHVPATKARTTSVGTTSALLPEASMSSAGPRTLAPDDEQACPIRCPRRLFWEEIRASRPG